MIKGHLYLIVLISFMCIGISCDQQKSSISENKSHLFFDPMNLGRFDTADNFLIHTRFTECGEWGGHEEALKIYSDSESVFYANHIVYTYNCDSARNRGFSEKLGILTNKTVKLDSSKQVSIIDYIHSLIDFKISEPEIHSHATNYYSAILSDSSFIIRVGDNSKKALEHYEKLISQLF